MKIVNSTIVSLAVFASQTSFASGCDFAKVARQTVKALVAVDDIKGITAYYGGVQDSDQVSANVKIQLHYTTTNDIYVVKIRNSDCRVLSTELVAENI